MTRHLRKALERVVSASRVHVSDVERDLYGRDASNISGRAAAVCFPISAEEVRGIVGVCRDFGVPFVPRGSGTGLAGGAVPPPGAVVISLSKMNRILSVDVDNRLAWVEPGVLNLDVTRAVSEHGLYFAPDPSSQQSCSIGGNVANNSGGPHCLADGVTTNHVIGLEVVLSDGSLVTLSGECAEAPGFDLRGCFIGSEGMFGVTTKICVRLMRASPSVQTLLMDFPTVQAGADTVSAVIAAGIVPAAMEMMDQLCLQAVEDFVHADLPVHSACALLIEVSGGLHETAHQSEIIRRIGTDHGAVTIRVAADEDERALLWKARKNAFGAIARIKPNYYLHDTVVPRSRLTEVLDQVYAVAQEFDLQVLNVFHAGDGNLHPLLIFDKREPGVMDRVHAAGERIVAASIAAGGVLSGEHGIGIEKRDLMPLMFSEADLAAQATVRNAFDPLGLANPDKVLPSPSSCGDPVSVGEGVWI
jgi:glycolate oxidase